MSVVNVACSAWLDPLRDQLDVQGAHGNWNYNDYMLGMLLWVHSGCY